LTPSSPENGALLIPLHVLVGTANEKANQKALIDAPLTFQNPGSKACVPTPPNIPVVGAALQFQSSSSIVIHQKATTPAATKVSVSVEIQSKSPYIK